MTDHDHTEQTHSIADHFNPKTILVSIAIALVAALVVYGSYNFYLSLDRYEAQNMALRAISEEEDGNYVAAINIRNEILTQEPENAENLFSLATLYFAVNDYEKTTETMQQYQNLSDLDQEGNMLLGKTYLKTGSIDLAKTHLQAVLETDGDNTEAKFLLAMIKVVQKEEGVEELLTTAANSGEANEAITSFYSVWQEAQTTENDNYADSLLTFGLLEAEQPYLALELISPVVELIPKYRDAHYLQAVAYFKTRQYELADAAANKALEIDDDHAASLELKELIAENIPSPTPEPTIEETSEIENNE